MANYPKWERKIGIKEEVSLGWGIEEVADFTGIPVTNGDSLFLSPGQEITDVRKLHGSPVRRNDVSEFLQGLQTPATSIEMQFNAIDGMLFVYSLFQRVWESALGVEPKIFLPYAKAPDFSTKTADDYPVSITVAHNTNETNESHCLLGGIVRSLNFATEAGAPLNATIEIIGKSVTYSHISSDTYTYGTTAPLLFQNANVLIAQPDASTASAQAEDDITTTAANSFLILDDHTTEYAAGNFVVFKSYDVVTASNNILILDENGTDNTVTLTAGNYDHIGMCKNIEDAIRASACLNIYRVWYDFNSLKFSIVRVSGSLTFQVDGIAVAHTCDALLGYTTSPGQNTTPAVADVATGLNPGVYKILSSSYGAPSTTVTFTAAILDTSPPLAAGSVVVYRPINISGFTLNITNNCVPKFYNSQTPSEVVMGDFTAEGTINPPWGQYTTDENYELNGLIAGYNVPMIIYWSTAADEASKFRGKTTLDTAIFFTARSTAATEAGDDERIVDITFQCVSTSKYVPPVYMILSNNVLEGWGAEGSPAWE